MNALSRRIRSFLEAIIDQGKYTSLIVRQAALNFTRYSAPQMAASLAFYALLSLFPLLTVLVAIGSLVYEHYLTSEEILDALVLVFPVSRELIRVNLYSILRLRGTVSLVSILALLWSSSGYFNTLLININRAWPEARQRHFVQNRLLALVFVFSLVALMLSSLMATVIFDLLPGFSIVIGPGVTIYKPLIWRLMSNVFPFLTRVFVFWLLYQAAPNTWVRKVAAFWGAIIAAVSWEALTAGLSWFLRSGLAHYDLVYGSLGAIVILMLWVYFTGWIILFGAHLSAAIAQFGKVFRLFGSALINGQSDDNGIYQ